MLTCYTVKTDAYTQSLDILLVEDNPVNQKVAQLMLGKMSHNTRSVYNGKEGVDAVKRSNFDIVFMDIQMPLMDGLSATQAIREWEKINKINPTVIIAMTANNQEEDKQKCIEAGMDDFLQKPFSMSELSQIIEKHLVLA